jgi:hypothetical protein
MRDRLFKKGLVVGIMILFFGVSIISSVSGDIKNIGNIEKVSYFRGKDLRANLIERINNFRVKNLKSGQIEKGIPLLFEYRNGWTPTELVSSESTNDSQMCSIGVDASGAAHVVWHDKTDYGGSGSDWDIFYKMKPSGGSWTTTEVVSSESSGNSKFPSIAVESDGTVHVAYDDRTETPGGVYYKMKSSGGSWTDAEIISVESTNFSCESTLDIGSDGTVHVAMNGVSDTEGWDIYYKMKPSGGSWTDAENVTYDSTGGAYFPTLDVESDGSVHIAWDEWDGGDIFDIYYKMKPSGGSWTAAEAVTQTSTESCEPSLVVDQDNNVHVTWIELTPYDLLDVCYKSKPEGGVWSITDILSSHSECLFSSSITIDSDGTVHVIFDEIDPYSWYSRLFYRNKPSGGSWSTIEMINYDFDAESWYSSIGVDLSGIIHVAWDGLVWSFDAEVDIFYKTKIGENQLPNAPIIDGPPSGTAGNPYTYTFTSTDPDGDDVSYYIKWGDGEITDWTAYQASGPPGYSESHTWSERDEYTIGAKAKDTYGAESDWAELKVTMPRNRATSNVLFYRFLEQFPILQKILGYIL